eukprot:TRINITY_DN74848_c0_g1_i1.p1 TRINITY_DN74848_c0_g1~~TRINITY_DN74848_c0_g1_i1.p1  ORF type:complete len:700 (-),score=101.70 TRINITY_DN74848_c0_g1_i1:68-2125(-)
MAASIAVDGVSASDGGALRAAAASTDAVAAKGGKAGVDAIAATRNLDSPHSPTEPPKEPKKDAEQAPEVRWQWEHRTGFKDYEPRTNLKIEAAYKRGDSKVRLKSGKFKATPMEIFFEDMIQHDPTSGNTRRVQRVGKFTISDKANDIKNSVKRLVETGSHKREVFTDYQRRRQQIVDNIANREFNVFDLYNDDSFFAAVARSAWFFGLSMGMVLLNGIWLWIDEDLNTAPSLVESTWPFVLIENMFCTYFFLEVVARFAAFRRKRDCLRDRWLLFDGLLALLMMFETWLMPILVASNAVRAQDLANKFTALRMLRLLRLSRMARLLRAVPEVLTLLRGIYAATRSVFSTLLLLTVLTFIFGIVFKSQTNNIQSLEGTHFPSVLASMTTLLFYGTFMDAPSELMNELKAESYTLPWVFLVFIFLSSFTLLNMLIGILCEVVAEVSKTEKEEANVDYLKNNLLCIMEVYDRDDDQHINREEFDLLTQNPELHDVLKRFGTDPEDLLNLADSLYRDAETPGKLSFSLFLQAVLRLRGDNVPHVTDFVELRDFVRQRCDYMDGIARKVRTSVVSAPSPLPEGEFIASTPGDKPSTSQTDGVADAVEPCGSDVAVAATVADEGSQAKKADLMRIAKSLQSLRAGQLSLRKEMTALRSELRAEVTVLHGQLSAVERLLAENTATVASDSV